MQVYIRKATLQDAPRCAEIHMTSWVFAYSSCVPLEEIERRNVNRPQIWKSMLEKEPHNNYVVTDGKEIFGIVTYGAARDTDVPEHTGEIVGLYLDPKYVGKGIGAQTMELVKADLKASGFSTMILWVLDGNYRAKTFYEKHGLKPDGAKKPSGLGACLEERYFINL